MTKRDSNNLRKTTHQGRAFLDIPSGTPEPPLKWEKVISIEIVSYNYSESIEYEQ